MSFVLRPSLARSEEVDDFTPPHYSPRDASDTIDTATDILLKDLVSQLNRSQQGCQSPQKYRTALNVLDQNFTPIGNALRVGLELRDIKERSTSDPEAAQRLLLRKKEIQRIWLSRFADSQREKITNLFSAIDYFGSRGVRHSIYAGMNLKGLHVGIDKIDHFFGNGGLLFDQWRHLPSQWSTEQKLRRIMENNVLQEHSLWGLSGLSPKSYADLAANWHGFHFYQQLFDGPQPFLRCEKGVFRLNSERVFRISDFADASWNESINCSAFGSGQEWQHFEKNLTNQGRRCPQSPRTCEALLKKHSQDWLFIHYALSPLCSQKRQGYQPVEQPTGITSEEFTLALRGFTWPILKDLSRQKSTHWFQDWWCHLPLKRTSAMGCRR